MTKQFCDLCGKPAEPWPEMRVDFPAKQNNVIEGVWVPHIDARIVFEHHDMPRSTRPYNPDLCGNCMADLLMKMSVDLKKQQTHP